ncbi:unnamed protein product [Caenorhabditis auriculariae]|uniref:Uncharacterized protein n=1 Tax=Caenorhabditis auriculariae TaxID=2777116 RepID=A0A8S1H5W4_9PELO|nr:unnamed protein product [Caenorhabditis auriculariae]
MAWPMIGVLQKRAILPIPSNSQGQLGPMKATAFGSNSENHLVIRRKVEGGDEPKGVGCAMAAIRSDQSKIGCLLD